MWLSTMKQLMKPMEKIFLLNYFSPCKARNLVRKHVQEVCARPPTDLFNARQELQDAKWASGFLCPDEPLVSQQGQQFSYKTKDHFISPAFLLHLCVCLWVSVVKSKWLIGHWGAVSIIFFNDGLFSTRMLSTLRYLGSFLEILCC